MKNQYITDRNGKKISVILPLKTYNQLLEELEEMEDIRLYDEAKAKNEKSILFSEYLKLRKKRKNV